MTDDGAPDTGRRPSRRRSSRSTRSDAAAAAATDVPADPAEPAGPDVVDARAIESGAAMSEAPDAQAGEGQSGLTDGAAPLSAIWSRHPESRPWLPVIDDRSLNAWVCPFLRAVDADDAVLAPVETPDVSNRCAALHDPVPQSLRQQELVCLTAAHVNCPRYLRGAVGMAEVEPTVRDGRTLRPVVALPARPSISPAIVASIGVLVVAFLASVSFVVARGGLELAAAAPSASAVGAIASATPAPTTAPSPTAQPTAQPSPSPSPTPSPAPSPSPSPTPEPTPAPTPEPTPSAKPTSARYALLDPCPDEPKCWIYTVRRGDNLFSIANYFGVSLEAVYARNPWTRTQSLRAGQELRLPPPTR